MPARHVGRLGDALEAGRDPQPEISALFSAAEELDRAGKAEIQRELDAVLRVGRAEQLGRVALLAGAIVEIGGEPEHLPAAIYDRIAEWLDAVPEDADAAKEYQPPEAFYEFERAAMAALSRSAELRRTLPQKQVIQSRIRHYEERYGFTNKMLSVLDDEPIVVLHPLTGRGWRCRVGGIADNFQLHTLLLATFAGRGDDRIEGERPSEAAIEASSSGDLEIGDHVSSDWQLANWTGLRAGGQISDADYHRDWIWNEGFPAEIASFDGTRVIAIGPSRIARSWNAGRLFDAMHGSLRVEERLSEAPALLRKIIERATAAAP